MIFAENVRADRASGETFFLPARDFALISKHIAATRSVGKWKMRSWRVPLRRPMRYRRVSTVRFNGCPGKNSPARDGPSILKNVGERTRVADSRPRSDLSAPCCFLPRVSLSFPTLDNCATSNTCRYKSRT